MESLQTVAVVNPIHLQNFYLVSNDEPRIKRSPIEFNLPSDFSWESIFPSNKKESKRKRRKRKRIRKKMIAQESNPKPYKVAKTTPKPSAIFFPTNENQGCGEATAVGSGFNTFGFLAMMITAFNAANIVASNNNNRNNNNNNNNNDNNDNNSQISEANTNGMVENPNNMIIIPPVPGRKLFTRSVKTAQNAVYLAYAHIMKALVWFQVSSPNCKRRMLCETNRHLKNMNFEKLAIVASIALVQNSNDTNAQDLMKAGRTGRISKYPCSNVFSKECSTTEWNLLKDDAENILWKE